MFKASNTSHIKSHTERMRALPVLTWSWGRGNANRRPTRWFGVRARLACCSTGPVAAIDSTRTDRWASHWTWVFRRLVGSNKIPAKSHRSTFRRLNFSLVHGPQSPAKPKPDSSTHTYFSHHRTHRDRTNTASIRRPRRHRPHAGSGCAGGASGGRPPRRPRWACGGPTGANLHRLHMGRENIFQPVSWSRPESGSEYAVCERTYTYTYICMYTYMGIYIYLYI